MPVAPTPREVVLSAAPTSAEAQAPDRPKPYEIQYMRTVERNP